MFHRSLMYSAVLLFMAMTGLSCTSKPKPEWESFKDNSISIRAVQCSSGPDCDAKLSIWCGSAPQKRIRVSVDWGETLGGGIRYKVISEVYTYRRSVGVRYDDGLWKNVESEAFSQGAPRVTLQADGRAIARDILRAETMDFKGVYSQDGQPLEIRFDVHGFREAFEGIRGRCESL